MEGTRFKLEASGSRGAVAAHNREAAHAGIRVLADGGTAFDAIVAMSFTTAVRETAMNGIGGGGVFLGYRADTGRVYEVNFYGRTPRELPSDVFVPYLIRDAPKMEFGWPGTLGNVSQRGPLSVGIPAHLRGLEAVHESMASMPWSALIADAEQLASQGFSLDEEDVYFLLSNLPNVQAQPEAARLYLPHGIAGITSQPLRLPDLANTLAMLRSGGADAFYLGQGGAATVAAVQAGGGFLSLEDLRDYRSEAGVGIAVDYHGTTIHSAAGMMGGVTLLMILNLARAAGLSEITHNSTDYLDLLARIMREAWRARYELLQQETITDRDVADLLSDRRTGAIIGRLNDHAAGEPVPGVARWTEPDSHTTSIAAVDAAGNLATITQTLGQCYGSCVAGESSGVLLYDQTYWFNPKPGSASSVGGWKRPSGHSAPVVMTRDGRPVAALSAPGGRKIVTALAQVVMNMIDRGMGIQDAIAAPRIHFEGVSAEDPRQINHAVIADHRIAPSVVDGLRARGYRLHVAVDSPTRLPFGRPTGVEIRETLNGGVDTTGKSIALAI